MYVGALGGLFSLDRFVECELPYVEVGSKVDA